MAEGILHTIVRAVEARLERHPADPGLEERAYEAAAARERAGLRSLANALAAPGASIIAECKHASPSAGVLRTPFDPVELAAAYERGGARAISVVTEPDFFGGDPAWIAAVRTAVSLPVLRKDFIVSRRQLLETAALGADAVLLISRILDAGTLKELLALAADLHLEVLLEIFCDEEPAQAVNSGARIIGVNARDLASFAVDLGAVERLGEQLPPGRLRVAESGMRTASDLRRLAGAGYDGFLIGERLVTSNDPAATLRNLLDLPF
ncbi:MAG: indole-3-glycerol-phosphate synthase [Acidobacteria bacterium]|nr:indole-3-glycerol-phosphate synthase [Acidobacteriota bacterium]